MDDQWFIQLTDSRQGPYTLAQLRRICAHGNIGPDDFVRCGTCGKWVRADQVDGLLNSIAPPEVSEHEPSAIAVWWQSQRPRWDEICAAFAISALFLFLRAFPLMVFITSLVSASGLAYAIFCRRAVTRLFVGALVLVGLVLVVSSAHLIARPSAAQIAAMALAEQQSRAEAEKREIELRKQYAVEAAEIDRRTEQFDKEQAERVEKIRRLVEIQQKRNAEIAAAEAEEERKHPKPKTVDSLLSSHPEWGQVSSTDRLPNWAGGGRERVYFKSGRSLLFYLSGDYVVTVYDENRRIVWGRRY